MTDSFCFMTDFVLDKIIKMESNLKLWKNINLTIEGKSLILKTFGLSQLIYMYWKHMK